MDILTEPIPELPRPAAHPGAYLPGQARGDRAAEYGGPAAGQSAVVSFTPMRHPAPSGHPGGDIAPPSYPSVVGPAPAIGVVTRP